MSFSLNSNLAKQLASLDLLLLIKPFIYFIPTKNDNDKLDDHHCKRAKKNKQLLDTSKITVNISNPKQS